MIGRTVQPIRPPPENTMTASSRSRGTRRLLLRVVLYYAALAVLVYLSVRYIPGAQEILGGGHLPSALESNPFGPNAPAAVGTPIASTAWSGAAVGAISMLGALAIMLPVTWIYILTHRLRGFEESVVHTMLILPVAVTGIVTIVQDSVPLAFSLAGIVAAVRFRTTLEDTKDAVYVFLAIGVGLACGVQAFGLSVVLSLFFNGVILLLWTERFGNVYAGAGPGEMGLGDAFAGPHTASAARMVGDAAVLDAAAPADVAEVLDRAARMEAHVAEERRKKKGKRANALLLVHAREAASAQQVVEPALDTLASRWKLAEILPAREGRLVLAYLARLDRPTAEGSLLDRLRQATPDVIDAAELRSLASLKKRS
jgi:hypothetical protein